MEDPTVIRIERKTAKRIKRNKIRKKETYDTIINRGMDALEGIK